MNGKIIAFSFFKKHPSRVDRMIAEVKQKAGELESRSAALRTVKSRLCLRCQTFTPHWQLANGKYMCGCGTEH